MPASQSRVLLLGLLTGSLISTGTWADSVIINTVNDENNIDNKSCSIREAVSYINLKNIKKAVIDEEIAIISGTSTQLSLQLINTAAAIDAEKAKDPQDTAEIARLEAKLADLTTKVNNGLYSLNLQLTNTTDALNAEKSKTTPNATLIADYEKTIASVKEKIKQQEAATTAKSTELQNFRDKGLFGCRSDSTSDTDTMLLTANIGNYLLESPIKLSLSLSISLLNAASSATDSSLELINLEDTTNPDAQPRTVIKAVGNHNLFIIDDGFTNDDDNNLTTVGNYITVDFSGIDFVGCNNNCATDGGIFFNKEYLNITNSIISGGMAKRGGAIFNSEEAVLTIKNSVIKNNQAESGAAIYAADANLGLSSLLITENNTSNPNNGVVTVAKKAINTPYSGIKRFIENATISNNQGIALKLSEGITVNNSTIVKNGVGIDFNNHLPTVYNSIIADNTIDCQLFAPIPADNKPYFNYNLSVTNKGCPSVNVAGATIASNIFISNTGIETLMAATDNNGKCVAPPANGLLCPLANNGGLTRSHKPRLLASYTKISDSPIVNKAFNTDSSNLGFTCANTDQRGKVRENNENICDIGAVEIISGLSSSTQGDDIVYGQLKRFSPLSNIGDAELLPAEYCPSILGGTKEQYLAGCIKLITNPLRGIVKFDNTTSDLIYSTTNPEFHGFDKFSYGVITTLSRFNDAINDKILTTNVKVVSEPPGSPPSKSLDSGANSLFSLLILGFLAFWRRIHRG